MSLLNLKRSRMALMGIFTVLFLMQHSLCLAGQNSRYLKIAENAAYTYYLDIETVRYIKDPYLEEKIIDVWIKIVCEENGSKAEIENRGKKGMVTEGYDKFSYSVRRYYLRLNERQMQMLASRDFASDGSQLEFQKYNYAAVRWDDLAPNTLGDLWYSKVRWYMDKRAREKGNE